MATSTRCRSSSRTSAATFVYCGGRDLPDPAGAQVHDRASASAKRSRSKVSTSISTARWSRAKGFSARPRRRARLRVRAVRAELTGPRAVCSGAPPDGRRCTHQLGRGIGDSPARRRAAAASGQSAKHRRARAGHARDQRLWPRAARRAPRRWRAAARRRRSRGRCGSALERIRRRRRRRTAGMRRQAEDSGARAALRRRRRRPRRSARRRPGLTSTASSTGIGGAGAEPLAAALGDHRIGLPGRPATSAPRSRGELARARVGERHGAAPH